MPVVPNVLERLLLFRFNKGPAPILDLIGAAGVEALMVALDLGVFEALEEAPLPARDLADRLDADETGIRTLLGFLEAEGYVAETGGRYRNTRMTTTWLTADSTTNLAPWFRFWNDLVFPFWTDHLERAVREGEPPQTIYEWFDEDPSRWETAQRGFRAVASLIVDEVVSAVDVPVGASRVIDIGGGHGLYAIELCRASPELSATVFDVPAALDSARQEIGAAGLGDRLDVTGGDYLADDLGSGYDIALVCNVIHAHDGGEVRRLLERVAAALDPGGRIVIVDQLEGTARMPVGKAALGFVGLTYLTTLGATTHTAESVADWLRVTGFEGVTQTAIRQAGPGNTLVQATKSGD